MTQEKAIEFALKINELMIETKHYNDEKKEVLKYLQCTLLEIKDHSLKNTIDDDLMIDICCDQLTK